MEETETVNIDKFKPRKEKEDGKADMIINIEQNVNNTNDLDINSVNTEANVTKGSDLEKGTVVSVQDADSKKYSQAHWVQYSQGYTDQGQGKVEKGPHYSYGGGGYGGQYDAAPMEYDPGSRNIFLKTVFIILLIMLIITTAFIAIVMTSSLKSFYLQYGIMILIGAGISLLGMSYVMTCCACARVPPCNFVCLAIVVVLMSNLAAAVTVRYRTELILYAFIATTVTVTVCVLLACSSFDFTKWYIYVVVIGIVLMVISTIVSIGMFAMNIRYKPLQLVILFLGAIFNVVVLIMELQMVIGGRAVEIGEDDYALAAYLLYMSIVDIFLKILQISGLIDN